MAELRIDVSEIVNRAVDKLIESGWRPSEWIPCIERLPEIYQRVLTVDIDRKVTENFRCNIKSGELEWSRGFGITHWMPLPEPPEVKQE